MTAATAGASGGADLLIMLVAGALAVGLFGSLAVWRTTEAAFTSTTSNAGNSLTTGQVILADDDTGTALVTVTGLVPGGSGSNCVVVSYTGNVQTTAVKVYSAASTDTASLGDDITLTIEEGNDGSGGSFNDCTGFTGTSIYSGSLTSFNSTKTAYASGVGTWAPATTASRVYRISYSLSNSAADAQQGQTATVTFQWEARAGA